MPKKTKKTTSQAKNQLPSAWMLTKNAIKDASVFWRSLIGILIVYAILYFVLVMGFSLSFSWQQELALSGSKVSNALSSVFSVFGSSALNGGTGSDATVLIQFLLFLLASLAFIWALRRLQALKDVKITDAYYIGSATLVQTLIVTVVLLAALVPLAIGSGLLSVSLQAGASSGEIAIVSLIAGILLLVSFYFLAMLWPAFYIATLPGSKPWASLKSAAAITKKRRFNILRKIIFFATLTFLSLFVIIFLIALIAAAIVPIAVFLLLIILFGLTHTYLYSLYRSLL
jgi:hypothetical protein